MSLQDALTRADQVRDRFFITGHYRGQPTINQIRGPGHLNVELAHQLDELARICPVVTHYPLVDGEDSPQLPFSIDP